MVPGVGRGPKSRVNWESLYRQSERFTEEVARNLAGPEVVADREGGAGWDSGFYDGGDGGEGVSVVVRVSMVLAVI